MVPPFVDMRQSANTDWRVLGSTGMGTALLLAVPKPLSAELGGDRSAVLALLAGAGREAAVPARALDDPGNGGSHPCHHHGRTIRLDRRDMAVLPTALVAAVAGELVPARTRWSPHGMSLLSLCSLQMQTECRRH